MAGENVKDYGAIGNGSSHPLSSKYSTLAQAQAIYPHATALTDEIDWCAIQAAANKNNQSFLYIPHGTYLINKMIDTKGKDVRGDSTVSTIIRATESIQMMNFSSFATIEGLYLDGNNIAYWGIKNTAKCQRATLRNIRTRYCIEGGFVTDGLQNSTLIDCNAQYNFVNFLILNHTRNIKLINCNAAINFESLNAANCRNVIIDIRPNDERLVSPIIPVTKRNSNIGFHGGIYEYGDESDYNIEIKQAGERIVFIDTEITKSKSTGYLFNINGGNVIFYGCSLLGADSAGLFDISGPTTRVNVDKNCYITSGRRAPDGGIVVKEGAYCDWLSKRNLIDEPSSNFQSGTGSWTGASGGTVTWNATKQCLTVSGDTISKGARLIPLYNYTNFMKLGRFVRINFFIDNIQTNNANKTVNLQTTTSNSPFRYFIGNYSAGEHSIIIQLTGTENGIQFSAGANELYIFDLHYVSVELL